MCAFGWPAHSRNSRLRLFTEGTRFTLSRRTTAGRQEVKALKPHISINVRNVTDSIEFYRKMLGCIFNNFARHSPNRYFPDRISNEQTGFACIK
jgi:hypothetical protein